MLLPFTFIVTLDCFVYSPNQKLIQTFAHFLGVCFVSRFFALLWLEFYSVVVVLYVFVDRSLLCFRNCHFYTTFPINFANPKLDGLG